MAIESKKQIPWTCMWRAGAVSAHDDGHSQEKLGEALGVTFQQVQKYEKAPTASAPAACRRSAEVLQVPVSFFFEGYKGEDAPPAGMREPDADFVTDYPVSAESIQLNRAFGKIQDRRFRRRILELVRSLAEAEAEIGETK